MLLYQNISDEGQLRDYLQGVYNTILMRDVVARENIRNVTFLENLLRFLSDNMGKLISASSFNLRGSIEKVMENVVHNHLRICGYKVTVGILRVGEIDFVATRGEQTVYVQVAYLLASQETIDREFGNLAAIRDNYPKYVVSMDPVTGEMPEYPGIHHVHLRKFLLSEL